MDLLELCEFYMVAPRSAVGITSPTLQNLSPNCIAFHAATPFESTHRYRATVRGRDS